METGKRMSADEMSLSEPQKRAGWYVERVTHGPHQDKRGAALLRCSPNMFWRLKRGEGWTVERLSLAAKVFGHSFVEVVFGPLTGQGRGLDDISQHVAEFDAAYERLKRCVVGGPYQPRLDAVDHRGAAAGNGSALPRAVAGVPLVRGSDERSGDVAGRVKEAAE